MAGRQAALSNELLEVRRQAKEAHEIDDRSAVFACAAADLLGIETQLLHHAIEGDRGFDGIEVLALNILDQGDFQKTFIRDLLDHDGHFRDTCELGCPPAAFPCDELIPSTELSNDKGLNDSVGSNGLG